MSFHLVDKRGVDRLWVDDRLTDEALSVHISVVEPGKRAHPPHAHDGVQAYYMLAGQGTMYINNETVVLDANQGIVLDPSIEHGLENSGHIPMRYMVISAK